MSESKQTIVLIDDDQWITDLYSEKLKMEGYKVFVGNSGKEGVELVMKHKPDIVLCDVVMSGGDGYYVLKKLKANKDTKDIPVLTLTNLDNVADRELCIANGACDYLVKAEFTPSQVAKKIEGVMKNVRKNKNC